MSTEETCKCKHVMAKIQDELPDDEILYDLAELFKVFGDSTRVKILYVLFESEMCVNDIAQCLGMTPSAVSHQLASLKKTKLVRTRKIGKQVYYSMADEHIENIYKMALEHIRE